MALDMLDMLDIFSIPPARRYACDFGEHKENMSGMSSNLTKAMIFQWIKPHDMARPRVQHMSSMVSRWCLCEKFNAE